MVDDEFEEEEEEPSEPEDLDDAELEEDEFGSDIDVDDVDVDDDAGTGCWPAHPRGLRPSTRSTTDSMSPCWMPLSAARRAPYAWSLRSRSARSAAANPPA